MERELFPLSWLSQYGYCPRRCGLMALDQIWEENADTAAGKAQHQRVHTARVERRGDDLAIYEMPVFSRTLGVNGKCDCVEAAASPAGVPLPYGPERYTLYPVEYKHGVVRDEKEYHIQLCAEAMCMEELFGASIPAGAIFFVNAHRRDEVLLDQPLRDLTRRTAEAVFELLEGGTVPDMAYSPKCKRCSLREYCQPKRKRSAESYCRRLLAQTAQEDAP